MIRVVLDTNVLVAALLSPNGTPARVLLIGILEPDIHLCISATIFAEYEEVLRRPVFRIGDDQIYAALRSLRESSFWVKSTQPVHACSDPDDDIFLDCAQAADANYLVTGNKKHFPPVWRNTRIVTPREFLDDLG